MLLGGLQKITLIDYPSKVAAIVFTIGCNFRCCFCYNTRLVNPELFSKDDVILEEDFFSFLKSRVGKLDAVVITGGEPTLHNDLESFILKIKEMGFLVKLDTNGTRPDVIKKLIEKKLVDYIAMDIKNDLLGWNYEKIVKVNIDMALLMESIKIIISSGVDYEFRTTVAPGISKENILNIAHHIHGAKKYYLQKFQDLDVLDNACKEEKWLSEDELDDIAKEVRAFVGECKVR